MTEPELLTALTNAGVDARAVLAMLAQYAQADTEVSCTLSTGQTLTLPGIQKQANGFAAAFAAMKQHFALDYGGGVVSTRITRNGFGIIQSVLTTFSTGLVLQHDYSRNGQGQITSIAMTVKDALGNLLATANRSITRTNGFVSALN